ncbi:MAG: hypothetical protein HY775_08430, partial [Acidobacteria bacterium]|nr:hypothetical protein [Acidobacteriota bacterium]
LDAVSKTPEGINPVELGRSAVPGPGDFVSVSPEFRVRLPGELRGRRHQTLRKERNWRKQGVLGVDMEMSALLAVARYHRLSSVCLLVVSDKHDLEEGGEWRWGGHDLAVSREQALRLFTDFIGMIAT